ncbi:unnamed protein product [Paramecium pentaurelia]|uniref:Transmembrane protein n=1 Tax=Paramecium pentaurelia TaxID=43138 RepID=A0A8S1VA61_9CILI|nr:unnamed protein product [Paramecium pentaurelia]
MMHQTLNHQNRVKTEPNQTQVMTPFYNPNRKTDMAEAYKIMQLINENHQITVKYSHIKIVLAIYSIFNLTSKLRSTKILKYWKILFQNLSKYDIPTNAQHYEFICNRQQQLLQQGITKLTKYTIKIKKKFLLNLSYKLQLKRKLNTVFNRIGNQVYQNKLQSIINIFLYSKKEKSLLDNLSYYYCKKQIKKQEKMAIKFSSSTLFIKALNNKVLQYQISFFIKLIKPKESQSTISQVSQGEDFSINNNKIRAGEFELLEKRLNGICLLNSVIKKIFHNYFLILKLQDMNNSNRRVSIKSSIFSSQSRILRKLMKHRESIMELYQSTNDTEQSKKDQEQDDIILYKKNTMCQTHHPESLIKKRISIIQSSQKIEMTKRQSIDLKTIKIQNQKSKFLFIILICFILGVLMMLKIFQ